jgi:hypothetical protein
VNKNESRTSVFICVYPRPSAVKKKGINMKTRLSKIAQLPKSIRDQLNHRLENGKQGPELLPWLNALSDTKELMADKFDGRLITPQNLSEWRRGGYQDWLQHQQRLEWFDHFSENETELEQHDACGDTFEAMSRLFIVEIGQGLAALPHLKNPHERSVRMENLIRQFTRLQNAYNFSRRVQLDYDKYNHDQLEPQTENENAEQPDDNEPEAPALGAPTCSRLTAPTSPEPHIEPPKPENEPQGAPASNPPAVTEALEIPAAFQPIPTPAPTPPPLNHPATNHPFPQTPTPVHKHIVHSIPIRGRRFVCIEG